MTSTTARQRVLTYLRRSGPMTAAQISRGLSMSTATVRHHLSILTADGRVTAADGPTAARRRGRPQKLYHLSNNMWGDNLAALADALLAGRPDLHILAERLGARMGPFDLRSSATRQLEQLVQSLNKAHYDARWEAGAEGPRILLGRCPYAEIIDAHPELCALDSHLLGGAMNAEAQQIAKMDRRTGKPDRCIFVLRRVKRGG
jgi:predicted ArsR family transcriptional regulator